MKTLLTFVYLFSLCAPVGAETYQIPNGHYRGTFTQKNIDKLIAGEDPCLAQLEAAMRAMEPFSAAHNPVWHDQPTFLNSETYITLYQKPGFHEAMQNAMRQWHMAKKECWKEK